MHLSALTLLANHLAIRDYSAHEVLDFTLRRVLVSVHCTSIIFFETDEFEKLFIREMIGIATEQSKEIEQEYSLNHSCPAAVAIRTGQAIWADDSKASVERFSDVKNLSSLLYGKTLVAVPILSKFTPSSAIVFFLDGDVAPNDDIESLLFLIVGILGLYFAKSPLKSKSNIPLQKNKKLDAEQVSGKLTERQLVIVGLVSEGHTNLDISKRLGYSESTIRHELMKIFKLYNFHHRSDLVNAHSPMPKIMNRSPSESLR